MPKGSWREFDDPSIVRSGRTKAIADKAKFNVRVQKTRGGKGGKTVTVIRGLELDEASARQLLKIFKARCGAGGTVKDGCLEVQGDQINLVMELLRKEGYRPQRAGG